MKKKLVKEEHIKIKQIVTFEFAYEENARNTVVALSFGGYLTNVVKSSGTYIVRVYTSRL